MRPRRLTLALALTWLLLATTVQAQFVVDSFTGTTGTTLASHTGETGATWTLNYTASNEFLITDANRIRNNTADWTLYSASGSPASADYLVSGVIRRFSDVAFTGVAGRVSGVSAYTCFLGSDTLYLIEFIGGVSSDSLAEVPFPTVNGTDYTVTLTMTGSTLKCLVNGSEYASATDSTNIGPGNAGVVANQAGTNTDGYHIDSIAASNPGACTRGLLGVGC